MNIAIGSDHGGYELKEALRRRLEEQGHQLMDAGCFGEAVDYPGIAVKVAALVTGGEAAFGILCCGTGIGISIAANKVKGIRCALCGDALSAEMTRRHNNANMLALGAFLTPPPLAERIVDVFLNTEFEGGRHQRRVDKISALEEQSQS